MTLRVLMLHNDYLQVGGEYFSVRAEAAGLRARGHDVNLLLVDNVGLASAGPVRKVRAVLDQPDSFRLVKDAIDEYRPDLIHAQNLFPSLGAGAIRAIQESGIPWVRTLRNYRKVCIAGNCVLDGQDCHRCSSASRGLPGISHRCYRDSTAASAGAVAYANFESFAERKYPPSAYIILSESMRETLAGVTTLAPVVVKPNAVESTDARTVDLEANRDIDVLFVGRLATEKNPGLLLDIAARRPDLVIWVVGDGPMLAELRERAASLPNVTVAGALDNADVIAAMARARVVTVPSAWAEPFGRVAAEALAVGAVPVVSNRGGLPDVVEGLDPRQVVREESTNAWLDAIEGILSMSEAKFTELSGLCIDRWRSHYSIDSNAALLEQIYGKVLK